MKIRTAEDVVKIAKSRGFKIIVIPGPPPMPMLTFQVKQSKADAQRAEATEALKGALKAFRVEIMRLVIEGKA